MHPTNTDRQSRNNHGQLIKTITKGFWPNLTPVTVITS